MAYVSTILLAFGVVLSAVSGLVCYMGTSSLMGQIEWLPCSQLLLAYPAAALTLGAILVMMCLLGPSSRVE